MAETKLLTTGLGEKGYPLSYAVGALVCGLIIGALLVWVWCSIGTEGNGLTGTGAQMKQISSENSEDTSSDTATEDVADDTTRPSSNGLRIENQAAGLTVLVANAAVDENHWVVIHEDRNGMPGNALGAARFVGGVTSGAVELLRGTVSGQTYHALLYRDNGDRVFSLDADTPVNDQNGAPIQTTFKAL